MPYGGLKAKNRGAAGPDGCWPQDFPRGYNPHNPPKFFHIMSVFCHLALVKLDSLAMESLGCIMVNIPLRLFQHCNALTKFNPIIIGRDLERMAKKMLHTSNVL